jgi:hypothetical protein
VPPIARGANAQSTADDQHSRTPAPDSSIRQKMTFGQADAIDGAPATVTP